MEPLVTDAVEMLISDAQFCETEEIKFLTNYRSSCPPQIIHSAAFSGVSKTLYVTEEVIRERITSMADDDGLCIEDRYLMNNYDAVLEMQAMGPGQYVPFRESPTATTTNYTFPEVPITYSHPIEHMNHCMKLAERNLRTEVEVQVPMETISRSHFVTQIQDTSERDSRAILPEVTILCNSYTQELEQCMSIEGESNLNGSENSMQASTEGTSIPAEDPADEKELNSEISQRVVLGPGATISLADPYKANSELPGAVVPEVEASIPHFVEPNDETEANIEFLSTEVLPEPTTTRVETNNEREKMHESVCELDPSTIDPNYDTERSSVSVNEFAPVAIDGPYMESNDDTGNGTESVDEDAPQPIDGPFLEYSIDEIIPELLEEVPSEATKVPVVEDNVDETSPKVLEEVVSEATKALVEEYSIEDTTPALLEEAVSEATKGPVIEYNIEETSPKLLEEIGSGSTNNPVVEYDIEETSPKLLEDAVSEVWKDIVEQHCMEDPNDMLLVQLTSGPMKDPDVDVEYSLEDTTHAMIDEGGPGNTKIPLVKHCVEVSNPKLLEQGVLQATKNSVVKHYTEDTGTKLPDEVFFNPIRGDVLEHSIEDTLPVLLEEVGLETTKCPIVEHKSEAESPKLLENIVSSAASGSVEGHNTKETSNELLKVATSNDSKGPVIQHRTENGRFELLQRGAPEVTVIDPVPLRDANVDKEAYPGTLETPSSKERPPPEQIKIVRGNSNSSQKGRVLRNIFKGHKDVTANSLSKEVLAKSWKRKAEVKEHERQEEYKKMKLKSCFIQLVRMVTPEKNARGGMQRNIPIRHLSPEPKERNRKHERVSTRNSTRQDAADKANPPFTGLASAEAIQNGEQGNKPKVRFQEFSIFDVPQPPKKAPHVRPYVYDKELGNKRKLSSGSNSVRGSSMERRELSVETYMSEGEKWSSRSCTRSSSRNGSHNLEKRKYVRATSVNVPLEEQSRRSRTAHAGMGSRKTKANLQTVTNDSERSKNLKVPAPNGRPTKIDQHTQSVYTLNNQIEAAKAYCQSRAEQASRNSQQQQADPRMNIHYGQRPSFNPSSHADQWAHHHHRSQEHGGYRGMSRSNGSIETEMYRPAAHSHYKETFGPDRMHSNRDVYNTNYSYCQEQQRIQTQVQNYHHQNPMNTATVFVDHLSNECYAEDTSALDLVFADFAVNGISGSSSSQNNHFQQQSSHGSSSIQFGGTYERGGQSAESSFIESGNNIIMVEDEVQPLYIENVASYAEIGYEAENSYPAPQYDISCGLLNSINGEESRRTALRGK